MGPIVKSELNHLASLFYKMGGRIVPKDFDFSKSSHPEEKSCWNRSCVAYAVIKGDDWFLGFQVD